MTGDSFFNLNINGTNGVHALIYLDNGGSFVVALMHTARLKF